MPSQKWTRGAQLTVQGTEDDTMILEMLKKDVDLNSSGDERDYVDYQEEKTTLTKTKKKTKSDRNSEKNESPRTTQRRNHIPAASALNIHKFIRYPPCDKCQKKNINCEVDLVSNQPQKPGRTCVLCKECKRACTWNGKRTYPLKKGVLGTDEVSMSSQGLVETTQNPTDIATLSEVIKNLTEAVKELSEEVKHIQATSVQIVMGHKTHHVV